MRAEFLKEPGPLTSAGIQWRVIRALLMREIITRYGRHNIGFLWLFVEPMIFTLGITALWTATKAIHGSNLSIVGFALTGYSTVLLWRNSANRCVSAISPNLNLMFHRNVKIIDIFAARLCLEIGGATISLVAIMAVCMVAGWLEPPDNILLMIGGWLLTAWFSIALGLIVGSVSEMSETFDRVWHTITYILFPLAGAGFLVDWLPREAQEVVLWLPMVHGVEMLRHGYYGEVITTYEDPAFFAISNAILTLVGLALTRKVSRTIEPQ